MKEDDAKAYEITEKTLDILNDHLKKEHKLIVYAIWGIAFCVCFFYLCYFITGVQSTRDCVSTIKTAIESKYETGGN